MRRKILSVLLAVAVLLSCCIVAVAAQPTMTVSSATAKQGETVELKVSLANNPGINAFSLGFDYDTSRLELLDVAVNDDLGGQFAYKKRAVWLNSKDTKYNGDILTLTFAVLGSAESGDAEVKVTYSPGDISNYNEEDVNFKSVSGKITVESENVGTEEVSIMQKVLDFFRGIIEAIKNLFSFGN